MTNRAVVSILLVVGLALSSMVLTAPNTTATGNTRYVDKSGEDPRCPNATSSIQAAINAASPGDTVIVCPGTYQESLTIDKSLVIQGFGRNGEDATYVQGQGSPTILIDADDVTFSGFNVSFNSVKGFLLNRGDNVSISNNTIRTAGGAYPIWSDFSLNVSIDDNLILADSQQTGGAGIYMTNENETGFADILSSSNAIVNNTVKRFGFGIYLQKSSPEILNNIVSSIYVDAIDVYHGDSSPTIKGNLIHHVGLGGEGVVTGTGIQLEDANATIEDNVIYDVAVVGIDVSPNPNAPCNGLNPQCRSTAMILNNTVYDVGNRPLRPRNNTMTMAIGFSRVDWSMATGNEIYNSTRGFLVRDQSYVKICSNSIHDNENGIVSRGLSWPLITNNGIYDNENGIYVVGNGSAASPTIEDNNFSSNSKGIHLDGRWGNQYLDLQNNSFESNTIGVYSLASGFNTIGNNTFDNNTYGLYLQMREDSGSFIYPKENLVEWNVFSNNDYGIYGNGSYRNHFQQNNISGNEHGVFLYGPNGGRNNVSFNNVSLSSESGVYLLYSNVDRIFGNKVEENKYGIVVNSSHAWINNNTISNNTVDGVLVENLTGNHTWFSDTFDNIRKVEATMTVNTTLSCGDVILDGHHLPTDDFSGSSLDSDIWKTSIGENATAYLDTENDTFVVDSYDVNGAAMLFSRYPMRLLYQMRAKMNVTQLAGDNHSIGLVGRFFKGDFDSMDYYYGKCPCIGEFDIPSGEWYQAVKFIVDYYQGVSKSGIRIIYRGNPIHFWIWNFTSESWEWYDIRSGWSPNRIFNEDDWLVEYPLNRTFDAVVTRYEDCYNFTLYDHTTQMFAWANTSAGSQPIGHLDGLDYIVFGDPFVLLRFSDGGLHEYHTYGNGRLLVESVNTTILEVIPTGGNITSVMLEELPTGWMWASLELVKSEPADAWINVSVLDGNTKQPIAGYLDISEDKIYLEQINPDSHPTIYIRANLTGTTEKTPRLYEWIVTVHSGISKNLIEQNGNSGISVHLSTGVVNISLNQVNDNIFAGIEVNASSNQRIIENDISEGGYGVILVDAIGIVVKGNVINHSPTSSIEGTVVLKHSHSGLFERNEISSGYVGIWMRDSNSNTFKLNNITGHTKEGVYLYSGSLNLFYWNNFFWNNVAAGPTSQACDRTCPCSNFWDAGYPTGGNYWSDYTGLDRFSGPNQNQPGSDGIGDTPYFIPVCAYDHYPLMSSK